MTNSKLIKAMAPLLIVGMVPSGCAATNSGLSTASDPDVVSDTSAMSDLTEQHLHRSAQLLSKECDNLGRASVNSNVRVTVDFVNQLDEPIEAYWINFHGELVSYGVIFPGQHLGMNTYITHPWVFVGVNSNDCHKTYFPKLEDNRKEVIIPCPDVLISAVLPIASRLKESVG
jgi:hypothetical protein